MGKDMRKTVVEIFKFEVKIRKKISGGYRITVKHDGTLYLLVETLKRPSYIAVTNLFIELWNTRKIILRWSDLTPRTKLNIQNHSLDYLDVNTKLSDLQDDVLRNTDSLYINIESNTSKEIRE